MPIEGRGAPHSPFETMVFRVGQDGLDVRKSIDTLSMTELARMSNVLIGQTGRLETRPGQTLLASDPGTHTTIGRLNDPQASAFTRLIAVGGNIDRGTTVLTRVDSGYSGDPVTFLPYRPPLAASSYMFIADRTKMGKISRTGPALQIGLVKPPTQPTVVIASDLRASFASFDSSDGTQAANWVAFAGTDRAGGLSAVPVLTDDAAGAQQSAVKMACAPLTVRPSTTSQTALQASTEGYASAMAIAKVIDATKLNGGVAISSDDDIIHTWLRMDLPSAIEEVRYYFVCSPINIATIGIPGTSTSNLSAYMRAYRPSDYTGFLSGTATATQASAIVRGADLLSGFNDPLSLSANDASTAVGAGANVWLDIGKIGLPVRRGDFIKIGDAGKAGTDWSTITGIIIVVQTNQDVAVNVSFDDTYIKGGYGPDSSEPGAIQYDYRVTNYDPRTGAESNPSSASTKDPNTQVVTSGTFVDAMRQQINITPAAYGDPAIRQRFYRRGGSLVDNWYFVGTNTADGALLADQLTDASIFAAGAVDIDHDQPVTTVDANGNAVLAQPIPSIWGPVDNLIMGCGDPYRPGDVYWCKPGEPDHWPAANHVEVCSPSEELMAGCVYAGQAFVFSRERGYALVTNLASTVTSVVGMPTECTPGLVNRWGLAVGVGGIYYVSRDAVRATKGGDSVILSEQIKPLFHGQTVNGMSPIDITQATSIRLSVHDNDLWFIYKDTGSTLRCIVYSLTYKNWRPYNFGVPAICAYSDPTQDGSLSLLLGTNGNTYTFSGSTDNGAGISCLARTGAQDYGYPRGDTLFGDVIIDADMKSAGKTLNLQTYLNNEDTTNLIQSVAGVAGRKRYVFDPFGSGVTGPQKARNISLEMSWIGDATGSPVVEFAGVSVIPQPNTTMNRVTSWDTPGEAEVYFTGMWVDCDTGTSSRVVHVETNLDGVITEVTGSPFTINPSGIAGRHKWWLSWPVAKAYMVRLRPQDNCVPWELYEYRWLQTAEPPRIAVWDTNWEMKGDSYYTGVDIECDTFGATKTLQFFVDQNMIQTTNVTNSGRKLVHITFPAGRGHNYRFAATDSNPGLLYSWKWITDPEPGEQTNWNQNYTIAGTLTDKWMKGAIIECDTFGQDKTVTFEIDGSVVATKTVNTNGRKVVEVSFPQSMGRVFRMYPTDANPGRMYSMEWIFDEEPLALSRWETQELDLEDVGWKHVPASFITIKSNNDVTLAITIYGQSGISMANQSYVIPSTGGVKQKVYVPFNAAKGILYKFLFTAGGPFWLYREESYVVVQSWGGQASKVVHPFGNDDLDLVRGMHHAALVAGKQGGGEGVK